MKNFTGTHVPIKSWCDDPEDDALKQARDLSALPFVFKHVCLMPDAHSGYGMPIGGVAALKDTIIPNAVGVDIGCGMSAVRTSLREISREDLLSILSSIRKRIPLGFNHHKTPQKWDGFNRAPNIEVVQKELSSASHQLGTLGGGNHFVEIQKGSDGFIWMMVHSGSRNFGYKIAKTYNQAAQILNRRYFIKMPQYHGEGGLAFLPLDNPECQEYIQAMNFALQFAFENRKAMIERIKESMSDIMACSFGELLNIHHNYAAEEIHFGEKVWVHRKGATSARKGEWGIIPGSQGTSSYIVKGKGNSESFNSCSHGAGRTMSRHQARKTLDLKKEQENLNCLGVLHSLRGHSDLDEAPSAYKNIDSVMLAQKDLTEPVVKLSPLAVIKG
jgi:tRNA-splicing ligase RtcB